MRVVLDTNEYISAFVFGGIPRQILERAELGEYELIVAIHIREELERVLTHKFKWPFDRIAWATDPIWETAHFAMPRATITASRDEADNRILECAVESGAAVIVTGDKDLLTLTPFEGILIVTANEFIRLLDGKR